MFLRHCWVRRKRLNEMWEIGRANGISKSEFLRLIVTVLCVIFVYSPLALLALVEFIEVPKIPFSISRIHGPLWPIIVFDLRPKALWSSWIGVVLAFACFILVGFTREARKFYKRCIEWIYDRSPHALQTRLGFMQRVSEHCKEGRRMREIDLQPTRPSKR